MRGRHIAVGVGGSIVVAALLVTGVGRLAGFTRLGQTFQDADLRWLSVCFVGETIVFAGYAGAVRYALAVDDASAFRYLAAVQLVFASFAATQLFAFAGIGGLAVLFWALRREGFDRDEASVRLIGLNTAVYLVFGAIGWGAALWALLTSAAPLGLSLPWLAAFPVLVALGRWFTQPSRVRRWTDVDSGLLRRGLAVGIGATAWTREMLVDRRRRTLFAWIACYWLGDIASLWAALHAYGAGPGVPTVTIAYATGYLAQSLPIPFIATAGVDAATAFLLQLLGVRLDIALAGVLTHRVFAFWLPVIPGSIFALTLPRLGRRLGTDPVAKAPST
ncbi:MAG: flippase-like protein [Ilumatobacteraceae bacterium]|nr:flippase-like protein [Ilumatobacteraceae bacterium]